MMQKLFVSGFPLDITEMGLAQLIGPLGDINTIKIVRDRQTKKCKGYAFVDMVTEEGAQAAIAGLNGAEMNGRLLTVKIADVIPAKSMAPKRRQESPNRTSGYGNRSTGQNISKQPRRPTS